MILVLRSEIINGPTTGLKMLRLRGFFGKFLGIRKYACVKDLTNIMSEPPSKI